MTTQSIHRNRIFSDKNSSWALVGLLSLVMLGFGFLADNSQGRFAEKPPIANSQTVSCTQAGTNCLNQQAKTKPGQPTFSGLTH